MSKQPLISLSIHEKRFKDKVIYSNTAFSLLENTSIAVTGLSGSGKSTLLGMVSGLDKKWDGEVSLNGTPIEKKKLFDTIRPYTAFVFQNIDLIDYLTVEENILLPYHFRKDKVDEAAFESLLKELRLDDKRKQISKTLSLGEKQRVAIARAFITKPKILFADEPTGSLDDENTLSVMNLLISLCKSKGVALFMVTHRRSLLSQFDKVYEIKDEKINEKTL